MSYPSKAVLIGGERHIISGLSPADPYFRSLHNRFDPEFEQFCRDFIRPGDICADIGANLGLKSLLMAQHAAQGQVIAIEAAPSVTELLRTNVARSGHRNITVVGCAVGDIDGTALFAENSAYGHLSDTGTEVRIRPLSDIIRGVGIDRLDVIKIDVEGFEFPILRSSLDIFERSQSVIYLEFNSWCQTAFSGVSPLAFVEWIFANFTHVFMVRRRPGKPYLIRLDRDQPRDFLHVNMAVDRMVTDLIVTNYAHRVPLQAEVAVLPRRLGLNSLLRMVGFELQRVHE